MALHVALIFGLGFTLAKPSEVSKSLEITLSTFKSEEAPKQADFLAQDNQQGSGTILDAVPPSIWVTCSVVQGGSKRGTGGRDLSSRSMRSSSAMSRAA